MRVAVGIVLALLFFAGLVVATLRETQVECQVCLSFQGHSACRAASGPDADRATQMAQSTACAVLANGVTEGIQCGRTPPTSVSCGD